MSTAFTQESTPGGSAYYSRLIGLSLNGCRMIVAYWKRRQDTHHLKELPDYLLKDVGLTRSEIRGALAGNHVKYGQVIFRRTC
ncbi:MAG: DUF1127 domain-containing protein [Stappiaceae bacterium]